MKYLRSGAGGPLRMVISKLSYELTSCATPYLFLGMRRCDNPWGELQDLPARLLQLALG